ncbi:hypothetical protein Tco_1455800 [Tanacetum coccineum]
MIAGHDENHGEPQEEPVESQPLTNASVPSTSQPTTEPHPDQELETETELHGSSSDFVHTPPTQFPPLQGPTSTYDEATRINVGNLPNRKIVLSDSESEDAANYSKQGRNLGDEDVFETSKGKDSGEADISPSGLQAAKTLVQVASQKTKTYTRRVKSGLKKKLDVGVSSGDTKFKVSQRKGKEVLEEQPQPKRSKKHIREEEASLAEIARIQAQEAAENLKRKGELQRLDALAAKRLNE